jgi:ABC-type glycerol-3-phosphate transport system substrate-binding protein
MRRFVLTAAAVATVALLLTGCGGSTGAGGDEAPASESPAAEATETATATPSVDGWTTVTTLSSDDPQAMEGILISEPFDAEGKVKLVLDMPDGGDADGVLGVIIPAGTAADPSAIIDAIPDGASVTMIPSAPTEVVSVPDGTCVFVNSVPGKKAWTLEIQTRQ